MKIKDGQSILFTGDSITDCGRDLISPDSLAGAGEGLGAGYVAFVDSLLASRYPELCVTVWNTGINGNTVIDIEGRLQADVLGLMPDWLSVMIGINDVWQQFDDSFTPNQVGIDRYEATYRGILTRARPELKGLVLMAPYLIEPNLSDPMRERMDVYGMVVERLAHEFDAVFVDVQAAFDLYLTHRSMDSLCCDRVHPNKTGHMIIAMSFLKAIEFDWGY